MMTQIIQLGAGFQIIFQTILLTCQNRRRRRPGTVRYTGQRLNCHISRRDQWGPFLILYIVATGRTFRVTKPVGKKAHRVQKPVKPIPLRCGCHSPKRRVDTN